MKHFRSIVLIAILNSTCLFAQQSFFPIGLFDTWKEYAHVNPNETNLDQIHANSAFNVVQSYAYYNLFGSGTYADVKSFLDTANSYGLKVLLCTPFTHQGNSQPSFQLKSYSDANSLIDYTASHAALYGYYIADEPMDPTSPSTFVSSYNMTLAYDSLRNHAMTNGHKIPMTFSLNDYNVDSQYWAWNSYNSGADFVLNDTYINHNNSAPSYNWVKILHKYDDIVNHNEAVQALINVEPNTINPGPPITYGTVRNTWNELRFQTYTAIIHGAQGVWYYGYFETYNPPQLNWTSSSLYFMDTLAPVSKQLSQNVSLLCGTKIGDCRWGIRSGYSFATSTDSIEYVIKQSGSTYMIIVANISSVQKNSVHLYLKTLPTNSSTLTLKKSTTCKQLSENSASPYDSTSFAVVNGVLTDNFAPYSVHVYRFSNAAGNSQAYQYRATKVTNNANGYWLYQGGNGTVPDSTFFRNFSPPTDSYWQVTAITYGDYDGDGIDERITALSSYDRWATQVILDRPDGSYIILYNKDGNGAGDLNNDYNYFSALASGDFDGNGIDEFRATKVKNGVNGYWLYQGGNGTLPSNLSLNANIPYTDSYWQVTAITYGDYNGDGKDERITAFSTWDRYATQVILDKPDGSYIVLYNKSGSANVSNYFSALASGDFDGNKIDEYRATKVTKNANGYWLYQGGNGALPDSTLFQNFSPPTNSYWQVTAITYGDYNGDGKDERITAFSTWDKYETQLVLDKPDGSYAVLYEKYGSANGSNYISALASGYFVTGHGGEAHIETGINSSVNNTAQSFSLGQNFPNPFNPATKLSYSIPKVANVKILVYDAIGREILTLIKGEQQPGYYEVDLEMSKFASGVYFYKLQAGDFIAFKKMLLLK